MLDSKKIKKEFLSVNFFYKIGIFFASRIKNFIFLLFFILSGYCGYIWYIYVYNPQWSEEKKADYLKTKDKEITFNRDKFQIIVTEEKRRAEEYKKNIQMEKDIFKIDFSQ